MTDWEKTYENNLADLREAFGLNSEPPQPNSVALLAAAELRTIRQILAKQDEREESRDCTLPT